MRATSLATRTTLAYLFAAVLVAASNAFQIAQRINGDLRLATRLRVHLYDITLFLLLGASCAAIVCLWQTLSGRFSFLQNRRTRLLATGLFGTLLGACFLANDLANFVANHGAGLHPRSAGMIVGGLFLSALGYLQQRIEQRWHRLLAVVFSTFLAIGNAEILVGDYPGIHLCIAITSLILLASAIRNMVSRWTPPRSGLAVLVSVFVASSMVFWLPPSRIVRQNPELALAPPWFRL